MEQQLIEMAAWFLGVAIGIFAAFVAVDWLEHRDFVKRYGKHYWKTTDRPNVWLKLTGRNKQERKQ